MNVTFILMHFNYSVNTYTHTYIFYLLSNIFWFQAKYIAQCMEEIKQELRQENVAVKATAVAKLTYVPNYFF